MKIVSPFRSPFRLGVIFFYSIRKRCMQAHMSALLPNPLSARRIPPGRIGSGSISAELVAKKRAGVSGASS